MVPGEGAEGGRALVPQVLRGLRIMSWHKTVARPVKLGSLPQSDVRPILAAGAAALGALGSSGPAVTVPMASSPVRTAAPSDSAHSDALRGFGAFWCGLPKPRSSEFSKRAPSRWFCGPS